MARTNVVLDDNLVMKCQNETGIRTRRGVIDHALQELLRHARQKKVLELKGRISWHGDLSAWRKGRSSK
ncbi:MAG: type II toxin-antitoxin system VapB family antitoxin [Lentisphaerae bacterium]|nr:type II toxin-antitoxin system VapB family antitoxin [Lentisphaerota bacterium]